MSIQGVSVATRRDFTPEEIDELRKDPSTSTALNKARRKAGQKGEDVVVRGDDRNLDETLAAHKSHVSRGKAIAGVADAAHMVEGLGLVHFVKGESLLAAAGGLGMAVGVPVATFIASQVALKEMQDTKDELRDAATRDVLRAGMLLSLELPKGFVDAEIGKLGVGTTGQAPAKKVSDQLKLTPLGVTLQHHCDQGMHAAQDCLALGWTKDKFFAAHPKLAERYASDAAFRAGFDAYVWAAEKSPADMEAMKTNLEARDVRYQSAGVPVRV
jgi:hypothetical protein